MSYEIDDIDEYKIVSAGAVDILQKQINELLKQGWKPIGGISSEGLGYDQKKHAFQYIYHQAVIKYKPKPAPRTLMKKELQSPPSTIM